MEKEKVENFYTDDLLYFNEYTKYNKRICRDDIWYFNRKFHWCQKLNI